MAHRPKVHHGCCYSGWKRDRAGLDALQELNDGGTIGLAGIVEVESRVVGMTLLAIHVPQDGLFLAACAVVVQAVLSAGVRVFQSTSPQRCGAAP